MGYIGKSPEQGRYGKLDQISAGFNGSTATFNLTVGSEAVYPVNPQALIISLNGVIQQPGTDFTVSAATITFTTNPASGLAFFGVILGDALDIGTPSDGSVTVAKMAVNSVDSDQYVDGSIDSAHIANDQIDSQHYAAQSIDNEHLADDAVGADELAANAVVNASIASGAAVEFSKMENLTNSRLLVSDGSGDVSVSAVTAAEILQLSGLSANVTDTNLNTLTDGSSTTSLHAHAGGGPTEATRANMEAEPTTGANSYVSPEVAHFARSAVKMHGYMVAAGTLQANNYNLVSGGKNSTGKYSFTIDNDFDSGTYSLLGMAGAGSGGQLSFDGRAAGSCSVETWETAGGQADKEFGIAICGALQT